MKDPKESENKHSELLSPSNLHYFQTESQRNQVGRKVLHSTRKVFFMNAVVLIGSFLIGVGIISQMNTSKAATNYRIATNGSDSNPCTPSQPCLTMNRAYAVASAGDTVEIAAGTYGSQTISGTKSSWVYFKPVTGATVRLGGLYTNADFVDVSDVTVGQWQITAANVNDVTLRNVTVEGYLGFSENGTQRISMYGGSVGPGVDYHPQIAPSAGNGSGWATDILFDGVYWHDWTRTNTGVHIECLQVAGTTRFTMRNNRFERCAIFDLSFALYNGSGGATDVLLENNMFTTTTGNGSINDGYYALNYGSMNNITMRSNTFGQGINQNTGNSGVVLSGNIISSAWQCDGGTHNYNVYQWTSNLNCGTDKWVNGPQYSVSNIITGPATTTAGLRIGASSPAKDFITPAQAATLGLPSTDFEGHARPVNTNYDAGADEYGSSGGGSPPPAPPPAVPSAPVVSISASPSSFQSGSSSTITWSATNSPTSCTASGDWSGTKAASGTESTGTLSTVKTYTYTLACTNAGGTGTNSATVTVTAAPPPPPAAPVISLSVSPSTISQGSSSTISWSATNSPTSCTASGDWSGSKSASGSQSTGALSTVKTYTYTLACTNAGGTTTGSVALIVIPQAPVVTITSNPSAVQTGQSSTISWSATNSPTSCTASGDWSGTKAASGSQSTGALNTVKTYTYTLTCSNAGGSGSASASVAVSAAPPVVQRPVVTISANPSSILTGANSTLSWSATNSPTSCTASGDWSGTKAASGSQSTGTLNTAKTYTYTLTCTNAGGSGSASTSVTVTTAPPPAVAKPVVTLTASYTALVAGENSTLSWSATNSPTSCTASGDWTGAKSTPGSQSTGALNTAKTYTYTLTCTNAGGSGSASVAVLVVAAGQKPPAQFPTVTLTAEPKTIQSGQKATLTWTTTNAPYSCKASDGWSGDKKPSGGSENTEALTEGKTYTLTCSNDGGSNSAAVSVSVVNISGSGEVKVNDIVVPDLKVDNPSIVGQSVTGEPEPLSQNAATATSKTKISPLTTTKGKIAAAGIFASLVTITTGLVFTARHYLHIRAFRFHIPGRGGGNGPPGPDDIIMG